MDTRKELLKNIVDSSNQITNEKAQECQTGMVEEACFRSGSIEKAEGYLACEGNRIACFAAQMFEVC